MSTESIEQYRAGFEAWARSKKLVVVRAKEGDGYLFRETQVRWEVWTAAMHEARKQASADFEEWARDNGHPIRFNADGSYAGMNSYRFEGYAGARREASTEPSATDESDGIERDENGNVKTWEDRLREGRPELRDHDFENSGVIWEIRNEGYTDGEIDDLRAEVVRLKSIVAAGALPDEARYTAYVKKCEAGAILPCSFDAFQAEQAKDAARYRWLCDEFGETKFPVALERLFERKYGACYVADYKVGIDAAIDERMSRAIDAAIEAHKAGSRHE